MLTIRLQRIGKKNNPSFRVVVTDSKRGPKSADFVERLGSYNPHTKEVTLDAERAKYWISNGAQASDTVHNLLISQGVIEGKKINVLPKKSPIIKEQPEEEVAPVPEGEPAAEEQTETTEEAPAETEAPTEEPAEEPKAEEPAAEEEVSEEASASEEEGKKD